MGEPRKKSALVLGVVGHHRPSANFQEPTTALTVIGGQVAR